MLKPIKKKNLADALNKLIGQLDIERSESAANQVPASDSSVPQQHILQEIALGMHAPGEIPSILSAAKLQFHYRYLLVSSLYTGNHKESDVELSKVITELNNRSAHYFSSFKTSGNYFVVLFGIDEISPSLFRQLHLDIVSLLIKKGINSKPTVNLGFSDYSEQLELLPQLIEQSAYALDFRLLCPNVPYFCYKETRNVNLASTAPNVFTEAMDVSGSALV